MNFGPSEKMGANNQEDELMHLGDLTLIWFDLYKEFLLEMSCKYQLIVLFYSLWN